MGQRDRKEAMASEGKGAIKNNSSMVAKNTDKQNKRSKTDKRKKERKNGARSVRLATKFWTTANTKWHKGKKRTKGAMQGQEKEKKKECVWWWWWWWSRRKMLTS